jgi:hypothetical protein
MIHQRYGFVLERGGKEKKRKMKKKERGKE